VGCKASSVNLTAFPVFRFTLTMWDVKQIASAARTLGEDVLP